MTKAASKTVTKKLPDPATEPNPADPDYRHLLGLVVWKMRHHLPALVVQITPADIKGLNDALAYNEQTLVVNAEPRNGCTLIHLTDAGTGDQIIPSENNEADLDKAQAAANLRQLRQTAPELAQRLLSDLNQGNLSSDLITEASRTLVALAKA